MKKQHKPLWTGSISYTAVDPIGGAMLRTNEQEKAATNIAIAINGAFFQAIRAVMKEVKKVSASQLWDDTKITLSITIQPQAK